MRDILFHNTSFALFTDVIHGQEHLKGKFDPGSPITVFNLAAISLYLGSDEDFLRDTIVESATPIQVYNGFNGIGSDIYLCSIHNIIIDNYTFEEMFVGVSMDYPIGKNGKPITKILIGMDILNSSKGVITESGDVELEIIKPDEQKKRMLEAFGRVSSDGILCIDELYTKEVG